MKIVYILAAILIFGLLIAVHEFGHFITAKLCGVKVNEFSIGMGPLLLQKEKGETVYSLRLLPIGGYCAMEGEDEERFLCRPDHRLCRGLPPGRGEWPDGGGCRL